MIKHITSVDNLLIKHTHSLQHGKYRHVHQEFLAEGIRTIKTLIENGISVKTVFFTQETESLSASLGHLPHTIMVTDTIMRKISGSTTPSGLIAICAIPAKKELGQLACSPLGLVLVAINNPGNMGTIIRSAAAFGIESIITIGGVDPWHPKVIQATAGTIAMVDILETSWEHVHTTLGNVLCALTVKGGTHLNELDKTHKRFLVIGSEAHGIPDEWLVACKEKITIPMAEHTESLNVAVATAIALYVLKN
jgi:RNA methyltransferase, TrmH family